MYSPAPSHKQLPMQRQQSRKVRAGAFLLSVGASLPPVCCTAVGHNPSKDARSRGCAARGSSAARAAACGSERLEGSNKGTGHTGAALRTRFSARHMEKRNEAVVIFTQGRARTEWAGDQFFRGPKRKATSLGFFSRWPERKPRAIIFFVVFRCRGVICFSFSLGGAVVPELSDRSTARDVGGGN